MRGYTSGVRRHLVLIAALLAVVLTAGPALAQAPGDQHAGGDDVLQEEQDRTPPDEVAGDTATPGGDELPVTGGDVAGLATLALASIVVGGGLLVLGRRRPVTR